VDLAEQHGSQHGGPIRESLTGARLRVVAPKWDH
jgi:hypothetical protein